MNSIYDTYITALEEYTKLSKEEIQRRGGHESTREWELSFTDEVIATPESIRRQYEKTDLFMFRNPEYYKDREEDGFSFFLNGLKDMPKDSAILDFGCGAGVFAELLLRHGFTNISMVDVKCPTTEFAKWFFKDRAKVYDDPDTIDGMYDAICSNSVFEHLPDPIATIYMLQRHLKPRGRMIVSMAQDIGGPHLERAISKYEVCRKLVESTGGLFQ